MQIPKISLCLCALALGVTLTIQAADNPDQAAARAALEAKMKELDAQQPAPAANPSATAPAAKSSGDDVVMTPVGKKSKSVAQTKAEKGAVVAKAKAGEQAAAAGKKTEKEAAKQIATQKQVSKAVAKTEDKAPKASAQPAIQESQPVSPPAAASVDNQTPASGALLPNTPEPSAKNPVLPVKVTAPPVEKQPVAMDYPGKSLGLAPITMPALPLSDAKQQKLQSLLAKYKADQISPEEYHAQRVAILAEP